MTQPMQWIVLLPALFLLGSVPFSFVAVRWRTGDDLRRLGSGNPGATNALRTAGPAVALVGLALDIAKGFVPVWVGRLGGLSDELLAAGAVACVLGHIYSPFLGFRGGKGVATGLGALGALNPMAAAFSLAIFSVVLTASRIVSLSSILVYAALPVVWLVPGRLGYPAAAGGAGWTAVFFVCAIVLVRHVGNLRRLLSGTEPRLGGRPA